jgi:hypothetical protein
MFDKLLNLFSPQRKIRPKDPIRASADLRGLILHMKPEQINVSRSSEIPNVWGVMMEIGMGGAVVTVVSLADGTTSMYFSSGGGIIGAGQHEEVALASKMFIGAAERCLELIPQSIACPMPAQGNVRFHLLTFDGYRSVENVENEIQKPSHPLYRIYESGQWVITKVRMRTEKQ